MNKLLVICGPTATGKTDLGISLARKFNGEIISADSRQVYKGMDIITGKDLPVSSKFKVQSSKLNINNSQLTIGYRAIEEIPIWLVDIVNPDYPFNVGEYAQIAKKVIEDIQSRNKLPIIDGGTGLYIKSLIYPLSNISIPPDIKIRKNLESLNTEELQNKLKILDKSWWERMNNSDKNNPRRLIRAIEIALQTQSSKIKAQKYNSKIKTNNVLIVGLTARKETLFSKNERRVDQRIKDGALEEIKGLLKKGYSWDLHSFSSTGIRQLKEHFEKKEKLENAIIKW